VWEYPSIDLDDALDKHIPVAYSSRFQQMLGYAEEELPQVADSWWRAIHPDDVALSIRAISDHLAGRQKPLFVQYRVYTRQGDLRWWQIYGGTLPDASPRRVRAIGVARDITDMKRAEETLRDQLDLITRQQSAIRAMAAPIIQVWDGIITLPLIGNLDRDRAHEIMDRLLSEIVRRRSRHAILDLTGIEIVDTDTAEHLYRIVGAVRLLGARAVLSGLQPSVAQILTELGADVAPFITYRTLQDALQACVRGDARPRG
ncbi:MAG TPA: PAS domain-containing protein, partial [Nannocystis sp.]